MRIITFKSDRQREREAKQQIQRLQHHWIVELEAVEQFHAWLDDKRNCRQACRAGPAYVQPVMPKIRCIKGHGQELRATDAIAISSHNQAYELTELDNRKPIKSEQALGVTEFPALVR